MNYDMPLYRPPSEGRSLIFQITLGCSWNKCLFCGMYKGKRFQVRPWEEIEKDIIEMSWIVPDTRKVFLADGDPLAVDTAFLIRVLDLINARFPRLERISAYAGPTNLMEKSLDELKSLRERKLDILYLGIETGNEALLKKICKGATTREIIDGSRKAIDAGLRMSTFIILGLGGVEGSYDHAKDSARVANAIDPQFLACLTLMLGQYEEFYEKKLMGGNFKLINKMQSLQELRWFVEDLEVSDCKFGTEHASNYLPLNGRLPDDKEKILDLIDGALKDGKSGMLRPEWLRGL
ncbi:MAG TPA: radical SAM protein [Deltaproteobacteria bacterium]|nr:radical SAM protein [Deltaproteobacteria bacterium]HQQ14415.1 radical SAM protein [Deltaproteobacteria bacterium]